MPFDYPLQNPEAIPSPALVVYRDRVQANLQHALQTVGDPARLRPHFKTHKTRALVHLERELGITRHKCATLREAEVLAEEGVTDILIAYPLVGPNLSRFLQLKQRFPEVDFKLVVDHPFPTRQLAELLEHHHLRVRVLLDVDVGFHRTGIPLGEDAHALYEQIARLPMLEPYGLHVYEGPLAVPDLEARRRVCAQILERVYDFRTQLMQAGLPVPLIVMGGTPSFPIFAQASDVEVSPGTFVFHDHNYTSRYPDLGFHPAALLLTRVISVSSVGVTLDLGYKAIAADPEVRGVVCNRQGVQMGHQNEEHWMIQTPPDQVPAPGEIMLVCPGHICPTVALHEQIYVLDAEGRWVDTWEVAARGRQLTASETYHGGSS